MFTVFSKIADPKRQLALQELESLIHQLSDQIVKREEGGGPSSVDLSEALSRAKVVRELILESPPDVEIDWAGIFNMIAFVINTISKIQN